MKALILAGGKGTRLRPLTVNIPKPVVPIANRPFLQFQLEMLQKVGIRDVTLALGYQPDRIEQLLGDGSEFGADLKYAVEPSPLGTAGACKFGIGTANKTVIVFNGDVLTDFSLGAMLQFHTSKKASATIAVFDVENPSRFGIVETDVDRTVLRFREKPKPEDIASLTARAINAGVYILEPEAVNLIPDNTNSSFEYNIFPEILRREMPFYAFDISGNYWRDIGTPENYSAANFDVLRGALPDVHVQRDLNYQCGENVFVDELSIIAPDASLRNGVKITNSVIGSGVQIDDKAIIENSVIWSHTRIGAQAEVRGSVICRSCYIGKNSVVSEGTLLGDKTTLSDFTVT